MIIGLYTKDFALLNRITSKIKDKNIKLRHIDDISKLNDDYHVLISKNKILNCDVPQIQPGNLDILELKIRCKIYESSNLIIGIDPGGVIGLSVIGAGRILFMNTYENPLDLATIIKSVELEIGIKTIKIGSGSPPERTRILDSLKDHASKIQLVNEYNSGSGSHTKAATRIALRQVEYKLEEKYQPKSGEIAWIQKESRRLSKGLVTIDKELAYDILIGKISMSDAISKYTEKIKNR